MNKKQIVEAALKELMDEEGRLTPAQVVAAAKKKTHPLHDFFEWDVRTAAHLHWLETASSLIRMVQYREVHGERTIVAPFFVHDPERPANEQGYRALSYIRTNEDSAREVLLDEMGLVAGVLKRARSVAAVLGMVDTIREIETRVSEFVSQLQPNEDQPTP